MKPLEGMTVLDLTHVLAGPYCTYQLHLLGAEVIKVESPKGDMTRIWGGTDEQIQQRLGSGFIPQNAGKKSIVVDIGTIEGAEVIRTLAKRVDIFVENYRPGTMQRFGLDYASIKEINPTIIYASISAFGQTGPHGHRPGFDDVVQATSGFMSINQRGDGPIRTGGPVLDYATGMHATSAILSATLLRERSGEAQRVDIAMQDVTMLLINRHVSHSATTGEMFPPAQNRDGFLLGRFATKDGFVMLAGYLPRHLRSILSAVGLDEFAQIPSFEMRNRASDIESAVEERLLQKTTAQWDEIFSTREVVAGGVRDIVEVLRTDQPKARDLFSAAESEIGEVQVTNAGYLINDVAFTPNRHLPKLGEHTHEVLKEHGYNEDELYRLEQSGVFGGLS